MYKQSGAALIVSLVILVIMTILGLTAIRSSTMQGKMATNLIDRQIAFQAAESALRSGENVFVSLVVEPPGKSSPSTADPIRVWTEAGALDSNLNNSKNWWDEANRDSTWWRENGIASADIKFSTTSNEIALQEPPRYIIEYLQFVKDDLSIGAGASSQAGRVYYRVTVRGVGGSQHSKVLLQSTTAKRY